ncbi:MAG: site-specific DNA-methyltransferase [Treponema sp.]|nr:site-specific DNA-methyltransferase [Treponema sp.]
MKGLNFSWPQKSEAENLAKTPAKSILVPDVSSSLRISSTENLYIEGDNLEVLKILQQSYSQKIKMIYIDPPYNTGNDFIYNDDFGHHTSWLNMIYPRLILAKKLLCDDGAIFISIDEGEIINLRMICNEIFGEENFVNNFMWLHGKGKKDSWSRTLQQYVVVYAKNKAKMKPWNEKKVCDYPFKNPDNDPKGPWFSGSLSFTETRSNPKSKNFYTIKSLSGVEWSRQWMIPQSQMEQLIKDGDISFGKAPDFDSVPRKKIRPGAKIDVIPNNIIDDCNTTRGAERYLESLFGCICFSYPKPYELIKKLASFMNLRDSIVLDFFSGSATTAEAVMRFNIEENCSNKFIMVQLPENLDEVLGKSVTSGKSVVKNAIEYLSKKNLPHNLCEIGKERIRLAAKKIIEEYGIKVDESKDEHNRIACVDLGFKCYKLQSK